MKSKVKNIKTAIPKKVTTKSGCNEVEKYLDKAVDRIKKEIVPRIDLLDQRDKEQYDTAKKVIVDAHTVMAARITSAEHDVHNVRTAFDNIAEKQEKIVTSLTDSLKALHTKLDSHIEDESHEFLQIRNGLNRAAGHVESIQQTLDNVSANGNKGLSNSMTDIYDKLKDLQHLTEGARARQHFWTSAKELMATAWFLKLFTNKWSFIFVIGFILLLVNSFTHALGIDMNLQSIIDWAIRTFKQ